MVVEFDPVQTGTRTGNVTVSAAGVPDIDIALSGDGTQTELTAVPPSLDFGDWDINAGISDTLESIVTNTGTEDVTIAAVNDAGDTTELTRFAGDNDCFDVITELAPGETCKVRVRFDPSTQAAFSATYTIDSNAPDTIVTATGTGVLHQLDADPDTLPFGTQDVDDGPTAASTSVLDNTGDQPVTIGDVTFGGANPKQFLQLTGQPDDCTDGEVVAVGDSCDLRIVFDPTFRGAKSANVTVESDAPDVTVALTGTATEAVYESSDDALDEGFVTNGQVNAVDFDAAGRTYLGGTFTHIGPRTGHAVKLTATSDDPDMAFPDVDGSVRAVAADGSGGWFIGGDFTSVGGTPARRASRTSARPARST